MKTVGIKCPFCGGAVEFGEGEKTAKCPYCDSQIMLDGGASDAGYEFEKGRLRAQKDAQEERIAAQRKADAERLRAEKKRKKRIWWVLGWIFFFPIPLTVLIVRSEKIPKNKKRIILIILWSAVALIALISYITKEPDQKQPSPDTVCVSATDRSL